MLWPPDWEELTHWKRPSCWERLKAKVKGVTEDGMVGWHHQLNGHEIVRDREAWHAFLAVHEVSELDMT